METISSVTFQLPVAQALGFVLVEKCVSVRDVQYAGEGSTVHVREPVAVLERLHSIFLLGEGCRCQSGLRMQPKVAVSIRQIDCREVQYLSFGL